MKPPLPRELPAYEDNTRWLPKPFYRFIARVNGWLVWESEDRTYALPAEDFYEKMVRQ